MQRTRIAILLTGAFALTSVALTSVSEPVVAYLAIQIAIYSVIALFGSLSGTWNGMCGVLGATLAFAPWFVFTLMAPPEMDKVNLLLLNTGETILGALLLGGCIIYESTQPTRKK